MIRKGSVTIFLAMILCLMLTLVCASLESVRMAAARTQILNGMDIGLFSLFAQYDKTILKDYDLLLLDGSGGSEMLDMASVYNTFESYMKPVLKQNSQKLSIEQGGFQAYRLVTDCDGEVFYQQAVNSMKETLGIQGVQLLIQRMRERKERTENAEAVGNNVENNQSLESYDTEMDDAVRESEELERQQEGDHVPENGGSAADFGDGYQVNNVENPIPAIKRIRNMGLLELVLPADRGYSENQTQESELLSGREKERGMDMGQLEPDSSFSSQVIFQQYLMKNLGNYMRPANGGLRYQAEYVLNGKNNDRDNLSAVAKKLLVIREGVNFTALAADSVKRAQIQALALAIASGFLVPPAAPVIEGALLLCWSFAESILDVRQLFSGGKVPAVKGSMDWQISLENLAKLQEGLDSLRKSYSDGLNYEDYLQIMMISADKNKKVKRGMDMIELKIRKVDGREEFCLDHCIVALEVSIDVKANKRKTFTVARQYQYI